jgi:CRP/FNR family cyclic AMP-dependent transcriptional regulator
MRHVRSGRLSAFDLFEGLDSRVIQDLEASARTRHADKHRFVYLPGDPSTAVFFLVSGRVKLSRLSTSGKELILEIVEPGSYFGETGVLNERPRETVAEALEASTLLVVPSGPFRAVLRRRPELLMKLAQFMGWRQKHLEKRLMDVLYKNAPQRLAELLLELSEHYGVREARGILLRIKLSQSALGNLLGVSREIVNHTFSGLRRRGVIEIADGRVIIQNPDALAELAA